MTRNTDNLRKDAIDLAASWPVEPDALLYSEARFRSMSSSLRREMERADSEAHEARCRARDLQIDVDSLTSRLHQVTIALRNSHTAEPEAAQESRLFPRPAT